MSSAKGCKSGCVLLTMLMTGLSLALPLGAQGLLPAVANAGFKELIGKKVGEFSVRSLSGSSIESDALAGTPTLYHVWSAAKDPSGEALALVAALKHALPGTSIFVLSTEGSRKLAPAANRAGIDAGSVAAEAGAAIRALGSPVAPAWIFASAGGLITAYKLGRLDPDPGMEAVRSLFAAVAPSKPVETIPRSDTSPNPALGGTEPAKPAARPVVALNTGLTDSSFAQAIDLEVVAELNLARTQPSAYADILREYRSFIRGSHLERPGEVTVVLNEGAKAVDEAIAFLSRQKPIPPLALSRGLSLAARDHARDQGGTGQTGHGGSDRSTMGQRIERYGAWEKTAGENIAYGGENARDIVIQLIVDDGVASRGHRSNIFNRDFAVVGIAFGKHPGYRTVCVQDFAGGYREK